MPKYQVRRIEDRITHEAITYLTTFEVPEGEDPNQVFARLHDENRLGWTEDLATPHQSYVTYESEYWPPEPTENPFRVTYTAIPLRKLREKEGQS